MMALMWACIQLIEACSGQPMESGDSTNADSAARADNAFQAARTRFHAETNNAEAAWQFARACFDRSEFATNNTERAEIAEQGIAAARQSITCNPTSAPAHYYLGMNLGRLADTRRNLSGLRMVSEMEHEFTAARDLNEHLDYAGPDRNLGLLYWEAPILVSVGSRSKARQHLERAVELAPDYPENRLNLIEAYLKWGDTANALRQLKALEKLWPEAKQKFAGDAWAASWRDWEKRFRSVQKRLEAAPKALESPRRAP
jgi:tetratricopeptide (TPR) repeat protein